MARCHTVYVTGAIPIGVPGCPESAAWIASMQSVRIVAMHRPSISVAVPVVVVISNRLPLACQTPTPVAVAANSRRHTLQVRNGRNSSRTKTFDAAEGETVAFRCSGKSILPIFLLSFVVPSLALSLHRE
jgi:hypothetical protein